MNVRNIFNSRVKRDTTTFGHFNAQLVDHYLPINCCCTNTRYLQDIFSWVLFVLSYCVLYVEWLLRDHIIFTTCYYLLADLYSILMRSLSVLLFPMYFRYFKKSKISLIFSFRRRKRRASGMSRGSGYKVINTKLGGRVFYDLDNTMPRIERSHGDDLQGEPKCVCCPPPMSGHRMLIIGDYAYVYGGLCRRVDDRDFNTSTDLWRLCLINNEWKRIPLQDEAFYFTPVSYAWIVTYKWGMLTFGGTGYPFGVAVGEKLCHLSIKKGATGLSYSITPLATFGDSPPPSYGGALVADEDHNCVYYIGGTSGRSYYGDVYRGDILPFGSKLKVHWTNLSSRCVPIPGRYRHEVVLHNEKLLIFGGGNSEQLHPIDKLTVFDLHENQFASINTEPDPHFGYPPPRDCFSLVRCRNIVYCMGGRGSSDGKLLLDDIWSMDLDTMTWKRCSMNLSFRTAFHASAIDNNGRVYTFGGHRGNQLTQPVHVGRTNMVQSFLACPPSLQSICHRFIAQTYKRGIPISETAMHSPIRFVQEVIPYYMTHMTPNALDAIESPTPAIEA